MIASVQTQAPASAQDLELVSALMSMRTGIPLFASQSSRSKTPSPTCVTLGIPESNRPHPVPIAAKPVLTTAPATLHPFLWRPVQFSGDPSELPHKGPTTVVTKYTPEERRAAVERYREKRRKRNSNTKTIRYQIRKKLADTRPRFRGRFYRPKTENAQ